jgi:hypothetical protein
MPATRAVKDLTIGEIIRLDGFEGDQIVRKAKPIAKGLEAGRRELTLVAPDGDTARIALAPEDPVTVVGKAPEAGKGQRRGPKAQRTAPAKARPAPPAAATPVPQAAAPSAPPAEAKRGTQAQGRHQAERMQPRSCLDAAAQVLTETGQPLSCPELIAAMAAQGYWTSPAGKTPAATLYAALLREIRTQKERARFRKTGPGRFARA